MRSQEKEMMENNLLVLLNKWRQSGSRVIQLLNKDNVPVGAVYLDKVDIEKLCICKTDNSTEKYMIFNDGLVVMFTYFRKSEGDD